MQKIKDNLSSLAMKTIGDMPSTIHELCGDGSDRKIFRLSYATVSYIGVYGQNSAENDAFVGFSRHFKNNNLPVPDIIAYDRPLGIYIETDFGDISLRDYVISQEKVPDASFSLWKIYTTILETLLKFQIGAGPSLNYDLCYQSKAFDFRAMMQDMLYFKTSFLNRFAQMRYNENKLLSEFQTFAACLSSVNAGYFLYRDFQSKNVMILNGAPHFIDYQSGRKGALQYDVASLLFDANVELTDDFRNDMLQYYLKKLSNYKVISADEFMQTFCDFVLLRLLQALAAFSFLSYQKGKTQFAQCIPRALKSIDKIFRTNEYCTEMTELRRIFYDDIFENPYPFCQ